jgi:hypothetical protein
MRGVVQLGRRGKQRCWQLARRLAQPKFERLHGSGHHGHVAVPGRCRRHLEVQDHLWPDRQQDHRGDPGLRRPAGDDGSTSHTTAYYVVHSDGSISLPFSQFDTNSSGASVQLISGNIFWPPADELSSGKAYHDALKIAFSDDGMKQNVTAHVTVRGGGTQSVTVPAGTYNADVVNMTMSETIEGIAVSSVVRTWLAPGVGPVKSEVILHEGSTDHIAAVNELVSFKAG